MKKGRKRIIGQVTEVLLVIGFLCFAGGYAIAGGAKGEEEQYTYGENISINVKIPDLGIEETAKLHKGMTPFDALLSVASLKTEYYPSMGASVITEIGGVAQNWGFKVNGEAPAIGMQNYQLRDGDNLELYELQW